MISLPPIFFKYHGRYFECNTIENEFLIELVRSYPSIYDLSNLKYMDCNLKQELWKKIGDEMKVEGK